MFNLYNEFLKYEYNELQGLFKIAETKEEQDLLPKTVQSIIASKIS